MTYFPLDKWASKRAYRWPAVAIVLTCSVLLINSFMDKYDEAQDMEDARIAAEQQDRQAALFRKALQDKCGGPEATVEQEGGGVYCRTKRGFKTRIQGVKS